MKRFRMSEIAGGLTRRSAMLGAAGLAACNNAAAVLAPQVAHPLWPASGPPVLRGAVIAQRRRRAEVDGDAFGGGQAALPAYLRSDFEALAGAGANLVVMSYPEFWTVKPPWRRDAQIADMLERQLDDARAAGLFVILALRSGPGRSDFVFHRESAGDWFDPELIVDSIWREREAQAAWAAMCEDAARLAGARSEIAGLNIMVEPEPNVGGLDQLGRPLGAWTPESYQAQVSEVSDWKRIAGEVARRVRDVAVDLPILISPPAFARTEFLPVMGAPPVAGVVWCVHDYEPRAMTHHPRGAAGFAVFGEGGERTFAHRIDSVQAGDAPLFLGEFGASRWADGVDAYYEARIAACEARGIGWAAFRWPTQDAGYERVDDMFNVALSAGRDGRPALDSLRSAWAQNTRRMNRGVLRGRS